MAKRGQPLGKVADVEEELPVAVGQRWFQRAGCSAGNGTDSHADHQAVAGALTTPRPILGIWGRLSWRWVCMARRWASLHEPIAQAS
jgi:hypothetical protein